MTTLGTQPTEQQQPAGHRQRPRVRLRHRVVPESKILCSALNGKINTREARGRSGRWPKRRRALEFRRMTEIAFLGKYAGEISRAARCFPGVTEDEVVQRAFALHRRLGDAVHSVLANGVRAYASELIDQTLPANSVLRMAVAEHPASFDATPIEDAAEVSHRDAEEGDTRDYRRSSQIRMALDERHHRVLFEGLPPIEGKANCSLVERLAVQYREDLQAGRVRSRIKKIS